MDTITITGANDPNIDVPAVQGALNDRRYSRIFLKGSFDFGTTERKTVKIERPVTIEGISDKPEPPSKDERSGEPEPHPHISPKIRGGGASLDTNTVYGKIDTGPFWVENQENGPVVMKNIRFYEFRGAGIFASGCHDLEIDECQFRNPVPGESENFHLPRDPNVPAKIICAVLAVGPRCEGRLRLKANHCIFDSTENIPHDEQFLGCVATQFNSIRVLDNNIVSRDEGIEIILNGYEAQHPFPCEISIERNRITIQQRVGDDWPGHAAILCSRNGIELDGTGSTTEIVNNEISILGPAFGFVLSGEHFVIRDNSLRQEAVTGADGIAGTAFCLGDDTELTPLPNLGPSFNDSEIFRNKISGTAYYGIFWYEGQSSELNVSHGNVIEDNDFSEFLPIAGQVSDPGATHDNVFIGNVWRA